MYINTGLHDLFKVGDPPAHQVGPDQYRQNLHSIMQRLHDETEAAIIWALITPTDQGKGGPFSSESDVTIYNRIAREVMGQATVPLNDLYQFVMARGRDQMLSEDGVYFTPDGAIALGKRVAEAICESLI